MSKFHHRNVMELLGVCIDIGESPYLVMPYMTHGSLLSYLRKYRAQLTIFNEDDNELVGIIMIFKTCICNIIILSLAGEFWQILFKAAHCFPWKMAGCFDGFSTIYFTLLTCMEQ